MKSLPSNLYQPDAKSYKRIPAILQSIPPDLPNDTCSACNLTFQPDWLAEREPLNGVTADNGSFWRRLTIVLQCPSCGAEVEHALPQKQQLARYGYFGDEAYRSGLGTSLATYSLVGVNQMHLSDFEDQVNAVKRELAPKMDPLKWNLHMKDIASPERRARHPIFSTWKDKDVKFCHARLFDLLAGAPDYVHKVNSIALVHTATEGKKEQAAFIKHEAYINLLMTVIDGASNCGVQPYFYFDAEKVVKGEGSVVHEWARHRFLGAHKTLVYAHLTRGIPIPEPEFVKPASRPLLELADFMSFVVAHYVDRRANGQKIHFDPAKFGKTQFVGVHRSGDPMSTSTGQVGFPWHQFFES